jgi:hypothetical protein
MPKLLFVDFACNDPDNGNFLGECTAVHLPQGAMELTNGYIGRGNKIDFSNGTLSFSRLKLPHRGHKSWVGNWCWDGCWLTLADTLKLLTYIKSLNGWSCDGGWCAICDPWEDGTLTEDILRHEYSTSPDKEGVSDQSIHKV